MFPDNSYSNEFVHCTFFWTHLSTICRFFRLDSKLSPFPFQIVLLSYLRTVNLALLFFRAHVLRRFVYYGEFRCTRTVPVRVKCEASGSLKVKAAEELRAATETHQFRRIQYSSSANTNTETRQSNELNAVQGLGSIPRAEVAFTGYATNVCVVLFDFNLYCTRLW